MFHQTEKGGEVEMTKQEILDKFNDINFVYNDSSKHETLSRMIDELLKEQEPVKPIIETNSRGFMYKCGACGTGVAVIANTVSADWQKNNVKFCQRCGRAVKWE